MSADNWAICPRCLADHEELIAKMRSKATDSYGKVPIAEFQRLTAEAEAESSREMEQNFREDYSIGVSDDGSFNVNYDGQCRVCELSFSYLYRADKIPMDRPTKKRKSA